MTMKKFPLWQQLNRSIGDASKKGKFCLHPLAEHVQTPAKRDTKYQQARWNLAKRSYTLKSGVDR